MLSIDVKAVKCGDCSVLTNGSRRLILDCGSDNCSGGLSPEEFAYHAIRRDIAPLYTAPSKDLRCDLLITHFHRDHFNGVLPIQRDWAATPKRPTAFQTAYLPFGNIAAGGPVYAGALARLLGTAPAGSWGFRLTNEIIALFTALESIAERVVFVRVGDSIPLGNTPLRVLWPDVKTLRTMPFPAHLEPEPREGPDDVTRNGDRRWLDDAGAEDRTLEQDEQRMNATFQRLLEADDRRGDARAVLLEQLAIFEAGLGQYLAALERTEPTEETENTNRTDREDHGDIPGFRAQEFAIFREKRNSLLAARRAYLRSAPAFVTANFARFARAQYHALITTMNAISIVCDCDAPRAEHGDEQPQPTPLLAYLGDVPPKITQHLADNCKFAPRYRVVKLPHHATDRYFTDAVPAADTWIVSNGGHARRRVSERFIDKAKAAKTKILCTNAFQAPLKYCAYAQRFGCPAPCCVNVDPSHSHLL